MKGLLLNMIFFRRITLFFFGTFSSLSITLGAMNKGPKKQWLQQYEDNDKIVVQEHEKFKKDKLYPSIKILLSFVDRNSKKNNNSR